MKHKHACPMSTMYTVILETLASPIEGCNIQAAHEIAEHIMCLIPANTGKNSTWMGQNNGNMYGENRWNMRGKNRCGPGYGDYEVEILERYFMSGKNDHKKEEKNKMKMKEILSKYM